VFVHHLILVYYVPNIRGEVPAWVCYTGALAVWMFQTLDALDGKQARKTGFIKPLGDLFDHGMS